jgi:N-acyl-phosphatidylethanolamine-hydrolysing phospholipase D
LSQKPLGHIARQALSVVADPANMVSVKPLPSILPDAPKDHHVGNPPTGFKNPWPSFDEGHSSPLNLLKVRFGSDRPEFVPVPTTREELVPVQKVDFANPEPGFKTTWIGHASFLLQTAKADGASRGINILCDPVFSERTSPLTWLGPKRYTPTPCTLPELLDAVEIDLVIISHNHYDHADSHTLKAIWAKRKSKVHFLVGLHNSRWLTAFGIDRSSITELDWWDGAEVEVESVGKAQITCTPTQHFSSRSIWDRGRDLWCSYAIRDLQGGKKVYFAGDTAYRSINANNLSREEEDARPACPTFKLVGELLGPFDLALLPIGLCSPREFMSNVHANSWDSIRIHQDVKSKRSIGMHWGTVRGGLSQYYEDVRTPAKHWKMAAEEEGLKWGEEIGLLDIGETLVLN